MFRVMMLVGFLQLARALEPPGQVYDFSGWKLQKCLTPGEVTGNALAKFSDPTFFLAEDGAVAFRTPDNCSVITAHATHPRTELREVAVPDWEVTTSSPTHVLKAELAVMHVAKVKPVVIIGQIHGTLHNEQRSMLLKLQWTGDRVSAHVKNTSAPFTEFGMDLGGYKLGERLNYEIRMEGSKLHVTVNGHHVEYVPPVAPGDRFYFKAGSYTGCNAECDAKDYAEVHFFSVNTTHTGLLV